MSVLRETTVSLDQLDDRLKAIVKLKLREFVHLSPCFSDIGNVDVTNYSKIRGSQNDPRLRLFVPPATARSVVTPTIYGSAESDQACPNRHTARPQRRRSVRPFAV